MPRILALVEGPTEQAFVKGELAKELASKHVFLTASLLGQPGHRRGGVRRWESVQRDVFAALKQDQGRFCTTMFDYYGMPGDWPGRTESSSLPSSQAAERVESALLEAVCDKLGSSFDSRRFVPYVQMHEFEALLFSDPAALASVIGNGSAAERLEDVAASFESPEEIDDNPASAPSKRILAFAPGYDKVVHGMAAARRIGVARMRKACPHFDHWLSRLEQLSSPGDVRSSR